MYVKKCLTPTLADGLPETSGRRISFVHAQLRGKFLKIYVFALKNLRYRKYDLIPLAWKVMKIKVKGCRVIYRLNNCS